MLLQSREVLAGSSTQDRGVGEHTWVSIQRAGGLGPPRELRWQSRLEQHGKRHWCMWKGILEKRISPLEPKRGQNLCLSGLKR